MSNTTSRTQDLGIFPVEETNRRMLRVWVEDDQLRLALCPVVAEAHWQFAGSEDRCMPTPCIRWDGELIEASTPNALWCSADSVESFAEWTSLAENIFANYMNESEEFRTQTSFISYAWQDHLLDV